MQMTRKSHSGPTFPSSEPEHLEEVVAVTEESFLAKSWTSKEPTSASSTGVYIMEQFHFHFTDIYNHAKNIHVKLLNVSVLSAFIGIWTYRTQ